MGKRQYFTMQRKETTHNSCTKTTRNNKTHNKTKTTTSANGSKGSNEVTKGQKQQQ